MAGRHIMCIAAASKNDLSLSGLQPLYNNLSFVPAIAAGFRGEREEDGAAAVKDLRSGGSLGFVQPSHLLRRRAASFQSNGCKRRNGSRRPGYFWRCLNPSALNQYALSFAL